MLEVMKIPISTILMLFFAYLIMHLIIGKKRDEAIKIASDYPNEENNNKAKNLSRAFKIWPMAYIGILLLYFYFFI